MISVSYLSLVSTSESVSNGRNGGNIRWRLVSSLLIAPQRRYLLILDGEVEMNPGPFGN